MVTSPVAEMLDGTPPGTAPLGARFEVLRELGTGGMGVVYEANDRLRGGRVALKMIRARDADKLAALKNEFRMLQHVAHENLVRLHELVVEGSQWIVVMELVEGTDIVSYVGPPTATGRVDAEPERRRAQTVRTVLRDLAVAVQALHERQLIHCDLKATNVLVERGGRLVVLDFGLAAPLRAHELRAARRFGSPAYMAPELCGEAPPSPAADWYGFGVLAYELLAGRLPFEGSVEEILMLKPHTAPGRPRLAADSGLEDLADLAMALLAVKPGRRPKGPEILRRLGAAAAAGYPSSLPDLPPSFVGRGQELALLASAVDTVREQGPAAYLIEGASGLGKSALVEEFFRRLAQAGRPQVMGVVARCYAAASVPYRAIDAVFESLARVLEGASPEQVTRWVPPGAHLLAQAFPQLARVAALTTAPRGPRLLDPMEQRALLFDAGRSLIVAIAREVPLVISIDDMQWAGEDDLAFLEEILRPPDGARVLLLATVRTDALAYAKSADEIDARLPVTTYRMELTALDRDSAEELARARLVEAGLDPAAARAIAIEADGHPLFIDELVRSAPGRSEAQGAVTLEIAIGRRLDGLLAPQARLLEFICAAGRPLSQEVLAGATGTSLASCVEQIQRLRAANLLRESGLGRSATAYVLHERIRQVVLSRSTAAAARQTHRELAFALRRVREDAALIAEQWDAAGDTRRAAAHFARAGRIAAAQFAFDRAAALYTAAARRWRGDAPPAKLMVALADSLVNAGRGHEASAWLLRAAGTLPDSSANARSRLRRRAGEELIRSGHIDESLAVLDGILDSLNLRVPATPRAALASLIWNRVRLRLRGLSFEQRAEAEVDADRLARIDVTHALGEVLGVIDNIRGASLQTSNLIENLRLGEPRRVARALAVEAIFSSAQGQPSRRHVGRILDKVSAMATDLQRDDVDAWLAMARGFTAFQFGDFYTARVQNDLAVDLFRGMRRGTAFEYGSARLFSTWASFYLGELSLLTERVPAWLREAVGRGDKLLATNMGTGLPNIAWLIRDEPVAARQETNEALRTWSTRAFHLQHYWHLFARVNIDLYEQRGSEAVEAIEAQWPALQGSFLLRVQSVRIEAQHLYGRALLARAQGESTQRREATLERVVGLATKLRREHLPWADAFAEQLVGLAAGLCGRHDEARLHLARAIDGFAAARLNLYAETTRSRLGEVTGGTEGTALVQLGQRWLAEGQVARADAFLGVFAPRVSAG